MFVRHRIRITYTKLPHPYRSDVTPKYENSSVMDILSAELYHALKEIYVQNRKKFENMTGREKQIMTLYVNGCSSADISNRLGISISTVSTHRKNIIKKTELKSPKETVLFAMAFGLL